MVFGKGIFGELAQNIDYSSFFLQNRLEQTVNLHRRNFIVLKFV